jgi:hypothetical protein
MTASGNRIRRWLEAGQGMGPASVGLAMVIVLTLPISFGGVMGENAATALIDWVQVILVAMAAVLTLRIARLAVLAPAQRRAFTLLAIAMIVLALADLAWAWVDSVRGENPSTSAVNWLYVPFYPLILLGVIAFPRIFRNATDRLRFMFDALIVAVGVGLLIWDQIAQPHLPTLGWWWDSRCWIRSPHWPWRCCCCACRPGVRAARWSGWRWP